MPQLRDSLLEFITDNSELLLQIENYKTHSDEWQGIILKAQEAQIYSKRTAHCDIKFGILKAMKKKGFNVTPNYK